MIGKNMKAFIFLTVAGLLLLPSITHAADQLDALKNKYAEIKTIEAKFQQKIYITAMKREREMKGEFFYKRGKGFLWKYTEPKKQIFLYDGAVVWQAEEEKPFVTRTRVDRQKMEGSFLDLVEDITKLDRFFEVKQTATEGALAVLTLAPKKEGAIRTARIWIDRESLVRRIEITEITGNVNTIDFSESRINKPVNDGLFVFKPGTKEVLEGRGFNGSP